MVGGASDEQAQQGGHAPLLSSTYEVAASAGNVIGGTGEERAQHGGQAPLLSPTAEEAVSAGKGIDGATDEQVQHGGQAPLLSSTSEEAVSAGNVIDSATDEQTQHGGQAPLLSPTNELSAPPTLDGPPLLLSSRDTVLMKGMELDLDLRLRTPSFFGSQGLCLDVSDDPGPGRNIRAGEARLNAETAERVAAEKTGVVTRSAARAKAAAATNEGTRHQTAKDGGSGPQMTKIKGETARHAREACTARQKEMTASDVRGKAKKAGETAAAEAAKQRERDSATRAGEAEASAGNVVGGAGDGQPQHGGLVPLLSPANEVAVSVGDTFNGVKDGHGWSGPTNFEDMYRLRKKLGFGWSASSPPTSTSSVSFSSRSLTADRSSFELMDRRKRTGAHSLLISWFTAN